AMLLAPCGVNAEDSSTAFNFNRLLTGVDLALWDLPSESSSAIYSASTIYQHSQPTIVATSIVINSLTQPQLDSIVAAAIDRWTATGLSQKQIETLRAIKFDVSDLSGAYLGEAGGNRVQIDRRAGGKGWFVDPTPQ